MKVRTSVLRGFALLALSSLTFAACDEKTTLPPPPDPTIQVTPAVITLQVGQTGTFVASLQNAPAGSTINWTSANPAVATVNQQGQVTAVAQGTASIIAELAGNPAVRAAGSVVVTQPPPDQVTLQLVPTSASVQVGGTIQLVSIVGGTTNQAVTYVSSAESVATVSTTGLVTAHAPGTAVITARSVANPAVAATSVITVTAGPPEDPITITITPTQATITVGATQQFVANVTGTGNTAVIWESASPGVATIDQNGLATGVAPGTTVITAISAADNTRRVSATLTVTAAPPVTQPAISIQSVQSPINTPIASGAGVGTGPAGSGNANVRVVVNVSAGSEALIQRVDVRFTNTETGAVISFLCQNFTPPLAATQGVQTIDCVINTQTLVDGQPRLPNGTYTLSAAAFSSDDPEGAPVAVANFGTVIVDNADTINLTIEALGSQAVGSDGLLWREGDVRVTATPAMFGGGTVSSVTICLNIPDADAATGSASTPAPPAAPRPCRTVTTATDGVFTTTFPKARSTTAGGTLGDGVANVSNRNVRPFVSAALTQEGSPAPTTAPGTGPMIRLDNFAPDAPPTIAPADGDWIGANFMFNRATVTGLNAAGLEDLDELPGVGGVTISFHVFAGTEAQYMALGTSVTARNAAVVATGATPASGADLDGTTTPEGYILVVRVRDALGNFVDTRVPGTFGVDKVAPEFNIVTHRITGSPAEQTLNPVTEFQFEFPFVEGNVSGTIMNPEVRIVRHRYVLAGSAETGTATSETRCINVNTGDATTVPTAGCAFVAAAGATVAVPAPDGYYTLTFRFRDNAGNLSAVQTRVVMRDVTEPTVGLGSFTLTTDQITMSARLRDNVHLRAWDTRMRFGGIELPVGPAEQISSFGVGNRIGLQNVTGSMTIWRSLTMTTATGDIDLIALPPIVADGAGIGAFDIRRNHAAAYHNLLGQTAGTVPTGLERFTATVPGTTFCNGLTPAPSGDQGFNCTTGTGAEPTSRTMTITASRAGTSFAVPFTAVHVYRVDALGNSWYVGQASFTASGSVAGRFEHRWTFTVNASGWQGDWDEAAAVAAGFIPLTDHNGNEQQLLVAVGVAGDRGVFLSPTTDITVRGAHRQP